MADVPPRSLLRLVYRGELDSFLFHEGGDTDPTGRRALVLLADADGNAEAMVICVIRRRTSARRGTILLLLDGEIGGEPITSVAYTTGNPFPLTSAGRRCVVHVDNDTHSYVDDIQRIWKRRLPNWVPEPTAAPAASP